MGTKGWNWDQKGLEPVQYWYWYWYWMQSIRTGVNTEPVLYWTSLGIRTVPVPVLYWMQSIRIGVNTEPVLYWYDYEQRE